MEQVIQAISLLLGAVGVLAFVVSMITQVIKNVAIFGKLPTDIVVFLLSIVLTLTAFYAAMAYYSVSPQWYYIVCAIIGGFLVAFVAMFGWAKVKELWSRNKYPEIE